MLIGICMKQSVTSQIPKLCSYSLIVAKGIITQWKVDTSWYSGFTIRPNKNTVKPAVATTSIKHDPPLSGHFRAPRTILNANAPLLSVHLSNAASGRQNSPKTLKLCPQTANFYALMRPVSIKIASINFFAPVICLVQLNSPAVVSPRINSSEAATLCRGYWAQLFGSLWCSRTAKGPKST